MKKTKTIDIITQIATGGDPERIKQFDKDVAKAKQRLELSRQIYNLRIKSGMTQEELSKKIGTKKTAISRWERQGYKNYTYVTLQKIADACDGSITITVTPSKPTRKVIRKKATCRSKELV